jgi:carboxyl-terminal processing protease
MLQNQVSKSALRASSLALGLTLLVATALYAQENTDAAENGQETAKEQELTIPFDEVRTFADIFARVKKDYVEPVEDKSLMKSAIRGMLSGLDPHSTYLDADEYKDLHEGLCVRARRNRLKSRSFAPSSR